MTEQIMTEQIRPKKDRSWLVYRHSIEVHMRQGAASKTITDYLEAIGYRQTQISPSMQFERGTMLAGYYNPNPRSQKTIITVDFLSAGNNLLIELVMRINRAGNLPLSKDYDFWATEIEGVEQSLNHGYCDPRLSQYAAERATWYSVSVMLAMLALTTFITLLLATGFILFFGR